MFFFVNCSKLNITSSSVALILRFKNGSCLGVDVILGEITNAVPKNCTPSKGCTLYVPDAFLDQYKQDAGWSQFGSIEPLSKTKYYTAEGLNK